MYRHDNFYSLNYIIMCTAASIFIEGHIRPYGRRLCTPDPDNAIRIVCIVYDSSFTLVLKVMNNIYNYLSIRIQFMQN